MTLPSHPEARAQRASKGDGTAARAASFEGGLRPPTQDDGQLRDARRRVAGFAHTLRDNGFAVGLAETRDALAVLASSAGNAAIVAQAGVARAVLRDPFRLGAFRRDLRCLLAGPRHAATAGLDGRAGRQRAAGAAAGASAGAAGSARPAGSRRAARRRQRCTGGRPRPPRGRLARRDARDDRPPPYRRSRRDRGDPRACGAARPGDAGAAGAPRAGAPARPPPRPAPHHPSQRLAWRHADRPRLAAAQDQAAAARRAARRLRLDEPLHRVLRPLPARRRRRLPRGRGLRLPHPARACLAVAARPRRHARGRPARR